MAGAMKRAKAHSWDVDVDFSADELPPALTDDLIDILLEATEAFDGVVGFDEDAVTIGLTVNSIDWSRAATRAARIATKALRDAGVPALPIERVDARTAERTRKGNLRFTFPQMMGVAEVAEHLHVSKQRVTELRDLGKLPRPLTELRSGPVWPRPAIDRFLESWIRKPGRPRSAASQ